MRPVARVLATLLTLTCLSTLPALAQLSASGSDWKNLQPAQQRVLSPLERDWSSLDATQRQKWLEIATRYPTMSPDQQERMQQRMTEWARMTPAQRGQARINFQQARTVPATDRQAQWEAYQALPPERKEALAKRQAAAPSAPTGATPGSLRRAPLDAQAPKSNVVAVPPGPAPRAVGPTLVQAGPGATTRPITQAPPQAHPASAPRPKIEVGAHAIDRATLLPKPVPKAVPKPAPASAPIMVPPASVPPLASAASAS